MRYYIEHLPMTIPMGVQSENNAEAVEFDVSDWLARDGSPSFSVWVTRPGETEAYQAANTQLKDGILSWWPTSADTATAGEGRVEILAVSANRRMLSGWTATSIRETTTETTTEAPVDQRPWLDQALLASEEAKAAATSAAASADQAEGVVKKEIATLTQEIDAVAGIDIDWLEGYYLKANGTTGTAEGFITSDFVRIPQNAQIYYDVKLSASHILVYDANKNIVKTISGSNEPSTGYISKNDGVYCRLSTYASYDYKFQYRKFDFIPDDNPANYPIGSVRVFNRCLCIGDSLTEGVFNHKEYNGKYSSVVSKYSYPAQFEKMTGIETVNLGHAGYTAPQWWAQEQNTDLSGYDMAIIMLGANDAAQNVAQDDTYAALYNIFGKIITQNPKAKVFIASVIEPFANVDGAAATTAAIKSLTENMTSQIYYVDIGKYSACKTGTAYVDGHLTALGYQKLASEFASYISKIVDDNMDDFADVQFIGTDMQEWHD